MRKMEVMIFDSKIYVHPTKQKKIENTKTKTIFNNKQSIIDNYQNICKEKRIEIFFCVK